MRSEKKHMVKIKPGDTFTHHDGFKIVNNGAINARLSIITSTKVDAERVNTREPKQK
jgi:hypothetical protein